MKQGTARILTALVGIPLILFAIWIGGNTFFVFIALASLGGAWELSKMMGQKEYAASPVWSILLGASVLLRFVTDEWALFFWAALFLFFLDTLRLGPENAISRLSGTLFTVLYPVWMLSHFVDIRMLAETTLGGAEAFYLTLLLFLLIWVTDTGAYYTGKSLGKHKFAPSISPNKTWEGTIGGLCAALLLATVFKIFVLTDLTWMDALVLAFLGGFWGQLGDLLESALKRSAGVKDSGAILPGHGGVLDRFDSLIFTAPAYFIYLSTFSAMLIGG